jgi:hypothetical protein
MMAEFRFPIRMKIDTQVRIWIIKTTTRRWLFSKKKSPQSHSFVAISHIIIPHDKGYANNSDKSQSNELRGYVYHLNY